ncbi:MAG: M61 family metallopeptidase [Undibacterium sp.]|nr:M61 family metallopeptidase [Undibacterium sp.]
MTSGRKNHVDASAAIHYTINSNDRAAHLYDVTVTVDAPDPEGQIFSLPVWIPGSYMVREFARNIVQIEASANGKSVALTKLDKCTWQATPCTGGLRLSYQVYAWDLSVRAAHLDQNHGFFNGTSVFLRVHGQEASAHSVEIQRPDGCAHWRVATALPSLEAKRHSFGRYIAADYDELVDHPVEMGEFELVSFKAHGVAHDFVVTGRVPNVDLARIALDLQKICEAQIAFFEPRTKQAPMSHYVFMTMVVGDGYGGLEHRASTALICNRSDLPTKNDTSLSDGYRAFLALCSHEYFHTWNVKRIKPAAFVHYDFSQENYTSLLWLFEGFTSYYDDLFLRRCGLVDEPSYLKVIAKTMMAVQRGSGRKKQSVADSSFDAWTKYYRQDENAPNAIVSYYAKGSLVALALDLLIRSETEGKKSLDDVMRALWEKFGRDFYQKDKILTKKGLGEEELQALVLEWTGVNITRFLAQYVKGTKDIPVAKMLAEFGVKLVSENASKKPSLGVKLVNQAGDCKLAHVYEGGAAHKAGLSAGDVLVAINGLRVNATDAAEGLKKLLAPYSVGDKLELHAFRRDELLNLTLKLRLDEDAQITLECDQDSHGTLAHKRPSL